MLSSHGLAAWPASPRACTQAGRPRGVRSRPGRLCPCTRRDAARARRGAPDQVDDELQVLVPVDGRLDNHDGRHALARPGRRPAGRAGRVALVRAGHQLRVRRCELRQRAHLAEAVPAQDARRVAVAVPGDQHELVAQLGHLLRAPARARRAARPARRAGLAAGQAGARRAALACGWRRAARLVGRGASPAGSPQTGWAHAAWPLGHRASRARRACVHEHRLGTTVRAQGHASSAWHEQALNRLRRGARCAQGLGRRHLPPAGRCGSAPCWPRAPAGPGWPTGGALAAPRSPCHCWSRSRRAPPPLAPVAWPRAGHAPSS